MPLDKSVCICTPGEPKPSGKETVDDLVDTTGFDPETAFLVRLAAQRALEEGIEPGIRRARWMDGFLMGYTEKEKNE